MFLFCIFFIDVFFNLIVFFFIKLYLNFFEKILMILINEKVFLFFFIFILVVFIFL